MKAKFLIFASIFLYGCSQDANQSVKQEDFQAKPPNLIAINHDNFPLDISSNREQAEGETILSDDNPEDSQSDRDAAKNGAAGATMNTYSTGELTGIKDMTVKVNEIHADITTLWNNSFVPMYHQYNSKGISNESLAEKLEILHESYQSLEEQVQSIEALDTFSAERASMVENLKSDLSLAISNRTLALIEFKLMNETKNVIMHAEMLDIHTENSLKYMSSAEAHIETLENIKTVSHSETEEEFVTTTK